MKRTVGLLLGDSNRKIQIAPAIAKQLIRSRRAKVISHNPFTLVLAEKAVRDFLTRWTARSDGFVMNGACLSVGRSV
jgi:hypothetical protein